MGRNIKEGLSFFPLDVDFFEDEKMQFVSARFGLKGEAIAMRFLCKIYRQGYFIKFDDDVALLFARSVGDISSHGLVKDVVNELIKRDFFNRNIFDMFGILTSKGIQKRYVKICKDAKRINFEIDPKIDLISSNNSFTQEEILKTQEETKKTPEFSTQRKEKKSKVNKIKEKEKDMSDFSSPTPPQNKINFNEIKEFFNENRGAKPKITEITDFRRKTISSIIKNYGEDQFKKVIMISRDSDFLNGKNDRGWVAYFDWIMKTPNFIKILEGNYKNKNNGKPIDNKGHKGVQSKQAVFNVEGAIRQLTEDIKNGDVPGVYR